MNVLSIVQPITEQFNLNNKSKQTYINLKNELNLICREIEKFISYQSKELSSPANQNVPKIIPPEENTPNEVQSHNINLLSSQITHYKTLISEMTLKLNRMTILANLTKVESEVIKKRLTVNALFNENQSLNLVYSSHIKAFDDYNKKTDNKQEIESYSSKLKDLKVHTRTTREDYKMTMLKLKGQASQMNVIEKRCSIIQQNLDYKKKQVYKMIHSERNCISSRNRTAAQEEENVEILKETVKQMENYMNNSKREYENALKAQKEQIENLNDRIKMLTIQIAHYDKQHKIKELKEKELFRREKLLNELKNKPLSNNNSVKNINTPNWNFRGKTSVLSRNSSDYNTERSYRSLVYRNKKNTPYQSDKSLSNTKSLLGKKTSTTMLSQIESLKNDIMSTIDRSNKRDKKTRTVVKSIQPRPKWHELEKINEQSAIFICAKDNE